MKRLLFILILISTVATVEAKQPKRGYRGFLEWSSSIRSEVFDEDEFTHKKQREAMFCAGLSTSHGYQINPVFFVGAGINLECLCNNFEFISPVFLQGRADFLFGKFTPFADLRIGYNLVPDSEIYLSPTIGYRFNWGRKMGVNIGLGLSVVDYTTDRYDYIVTGPDSYEMYFVKKEHNVMAFFTFRVGIDF